MKKKIRRLRRFLESIQSFALVDLLVSPDVLVHSILQDIVDAVGMHAWGKKIYHKDMYGEDSEEGEMSGEMNIGWEEDEGDVGANIKISVSPYHVVFNLYSLADGQRYDRFVVSRDGGDYIGLINNIVRSIKQIISATKKGRYAPYTADDHLLGIDRGN